MAANLLLWRWKKKVSQVAINLSERGLFNSFLINVRVVFWVIFLYAKRLLLHSNDQNFVSFFMQLEFSYYKKKFIGSFSSAFISFSYSHSDSEKLFGQWLWNQLGFFKPFLITLIKSNDGHKKCTLITEIKRREKKKTKNVFFSRCVINKEKNKIFPFFFIISKFLSNFIKLGKGSLVWVNLLFLHF